ncbi:hypothetical protein [Nocardioides sp.]|uniref:hypothetical protein n=1 Tax=Nocardioides sp. TaxID=35761 RepID=UPI0027233675|nr:hypothetical protein [Nocardioides sp.]MDO9458476.1 hypothetical protein [Nocardioides sp.]
MTGSGARLLVALSLVAVAGCSNGAASPEESEVNQDLAAAIAHDLAGPGYDLEVSYVDDASTRAKVVVEVACEACRPGPVLDQALEAVWTSEITPLDTITVRSKVASPLGGDTVYYRMPEDAAALERRFGARPVGVGSGE